MPKSTSILSTDIQFNAQRTERFSGNTVCVDRGNNVRSRLMNGAVDHESGRVDCMHIPTFTDLALLVHENEIRGSDGLERAENRIDPEMIQLDGIADRNVTCSALVTVTVLTHPAEGLE